MTQVSLRKSLKPSLNLDARKVRQKTQRNHGEFRRVKALLACLHSQASGSRKTELWAPLWNFETSVSVYRKGGWKTDPS